MDKKLFREKLLRNLLIVLTVDICLWSIAILINYKSNNNTIQPFLFQALGLAKKLPEQVVYFNNLSGILALFIVPVFNFIYLMITLNTGYRKTILIWCLIPFNWSALYSCFLALIFIFFILSIGSYKSGTWKQ